jgi:hypothetical protein
LTAVLNGLIPLQHLDDPFKAMSQKLYDLLEQFRLLIYGHLIDIGSGLPTQSNTHGVVQKAIPDAHVVYVDDDPMVRAYATAPTGGSVASLADPSSRWHARPSESRNVPRHTDAIAAWLLG